MSVLPEEIALDMMETVPVVMRVMRAPTCAGPASPI